MKNNIEVGLILSCFSLCSLTSYAQVAGSSTTQPSTTGTGAPSGTTAATQQPNETRGASSGHEGRSDSAKGSEGEVNGSVKPAETSRAVNNPECTAEQMKKHPKKCDTRRNKVKSHK